MEGCGAEGLPHEIVGLKREPEEYRSPPDASYALAVQVKVEHLDILNEEKSVKEDIEHLHEMKDEPCSNSLQYGLSEAAMQASLYTDHEVKDDVVVGLESLHRPNVNLVIRDRKRPFTLNECSVRLERQPHLEVLSNKHQNTASDFDPIIIHESEMEKKEVCHRVDKSDKREPTCDLCGKCFVLKSDLRKHVMEHIYVPTSTPDASGQDYAEASKERALRRKHALRDCCVRLERLPHESLPCSQRKPPEDITHADTESNTREKIFRVYNPKCDICGRIFALISDLKKHAMIHIHMPVRVQSEAPTIYPEISDTDTEMNINIDCDNEPVCDLCGEKFNSDSDLMKHVMIHVYVATSNQQPPYNAKVRKCVDNTSNTKTFQRNEFQYQNKHIKTYSKTKSDFKYVRTEEKPYSRDTSKMDYEKKQCLKERLVIHNKDKHSYKICKKEFKTLTHLKTHVPVRPRLRPFKCDICKTSFAYKRCLEAHLESHRLGEPYYCKICNRHFSRLIYLHKHIKYTITHKEMKAFSLKKKHGNKIGMMKHYEFCNKNKLHWIKMSNMC